MPMPIAPGSRKFNVLWILSDQHAYEAAGCYGNKIVQTPNLDRLAAEGLRFDAAYTPAPVCVPARDAILAGRYPHRIPGVAQGGAILPHVPTAAHLFRSAGYVTGHIGKMHPVAPYTRGFDVLVDMGHYYDYLGPKVEVFARGMDAANSGCGLPWMDQWYKAYAWPPAPRLPDAAPRTDRPWRIGGWRGEPFRDDMPRILPEEDHFEAFVVRMCDAFLDAHGNAPFFLVASFLKPHYPEVAPPEYHASYDPANLTLPADAGAWDIVPAGARALLTPDLNTPDNQAVALRWLADYYACVTYVDECLGRLLASLDRRGLSDNTLVVYTSDHGDMLYHHGLRHKLVFFEPSARVPLVMRLPGVVPAGSATKALCDLTDLLPTSLAVCGLPCDHGCDGADQSPLFDDQVASVRDACFSELPGDQRYMIRTDRWKLWRWGNEDWVLSDMLTDPAESRNRYSELGNTREVMAMRERLIGWRAR
jgi:choline-sulfatase